MTMFFDGEKPVWQDHQHYPWNEYKHLDREKFEELVQCMVDAYPDHELTEWLQRGFCMNEGDSTISFSSWKDIKCYNGASITLMKKTTRILTYGGDRAKKKLNLIGRQTPHSVIY